MAKVLCLDEDDFEKSEFSILEISESFDDKLFFNGSVKFCLLSSSIVGSTFCDDLCSEWDEVLMEAEKKMEKIKNKI